MIGSGPLLIGWLVPQREIEYRVNENVVALLVACTAALLVLPRRWAPVPIVICVCYITRAQSIDLGPYSFTPVRILIVIGFVRVLVRREWLAHGVSGLDRLILVWGLWMVLSTYFHVDAATQVVNRFGLVLDGWGLYFLFRIFCRSRDELSRLFGIVAVLLVPVAAEMVAEQITLRNSFAVFGGVPAFPEIRDGRLRAQGPFAHSILAGNIGAVTVPLMIGLWSLNRYLALLGMAVCMTIVVASSSSGPIMSALFGLAAICLWPYRYSLHLFRRAAVLCYLLLMVVMNSPPYYLIAKIDLVGGSTGWHRSRLIESAFEHFGEWWLIGTDYTRHWMPTGVSYSPDHTDITNHYLMAGVLGGVPLMLLFILILSTGFSYIGRALRQTPKPSRQEEFLIWSVGAALFGHAATCIAVAYFDQSIAFLYLTLAAAGAVRFGAATAVAADAAAEKAPLSGSRSRLVARSRRQLGTRRGRRNWSRPEAAPRLAP